MLKRERRIVREVGRVGGADKRKLVELNVLRGIVKVKACFILSMNWDRLQISVK